MVVDTGSLLSSSWVAPAQSASWWAFLLGENVHVELVNAVLCADAVFIQGRGCARLCRSRIADAALHHVRP